MKLRRQKSVSRGEKKSPEILIGSVPNSYRKKRLIVPVLVLILVAFIATAAYVIFRNQNSKNTDNIQLTGTALDAAQREQLLAQGQKPEYTDYLILGNYYREKRDFAKAEGYYKKAEGLAADDFDVDYALASIYRVQHKKEQSISYYDKIIAKASVPDSPRSANLKTYQKELEAVKAGDFDLKTVKVDSEIPL